MRLDMDKIQFESRREIEDMMMALEEAIQKTNDEKNRILLKDLQEKLYTMHIGW